MRPLYGADLCQAVDIFSDKNVTKNEDQARQDIFVSYQFNVNGVRENITISLWICILFLRTVIVIFGFFFRWKGMGHVTCQSVHRVHNRNHPNVYWRSTEHLNNVIHTPDGYLNELEDIISR